MKKSLLFLFTLFTVSANAQTWVYHPFPETNGAWNFTTRYWCWSGVPQPVDNSYSLGISGDTIISSQTYHKLVVPLYQTNASACGPSTSMFNIYKGAVRQDIGMKKVFFVPGGSSSEQLLYDFNMQVGDTVKGYLETDLFFKDTVESIDSVMVGGTYRKRWNIDFAYQVQLIEGIGCTYGLVEPSPGTGPDHVEYTMNCYQQTGATLYPDATTACELITAVDRIEKVPELLNVFPNPSADAFTIDAGNLMMKEIRITDILGNIVFQKQETMQSKITIDHLQSGTYILTVINKDGSVMNKKIVRL